MSRSRIASFALCLVGVLVACLALPVTASAATRPPAFRPQLAGPGAVRPLFAPAAAHAKTAKAQYSCSFDAYGSGISPVMVSMTSEVQSPWPVNQPDEVAVANDDAITLPTAVSSQLTGIDSITVQAQATAKNATPSTISLEGLAVASSPVTLTEIPAQLPAAGQVTFPAKGTSGSVALPVHTVTYTPMAGTTAKPVITCTASTQPADVSVTVGDASGSFYHCTATVSGAGSATSAGPVAMTFSSSGTKKTGHSVSITLGSSDIAGLISAFNALGSGITQAVVSADLAVTGAQSGKLHMSKTITDLTATSFTMSGSLKLTKAGTVKVDIPSDFGVALSASGTTVLDLSCSLVTKPAPVALTLSVTQGSSSSPGVCTTASPTTTVIATVTPTVTTTPTVTVTPTTTTNASPTVTPTVTVTPTTTVTPTVTVTPTTTASPTPCASSGGSGGSGGSEEGSGTPSGGVATGGGVAPGANVALGIGGAALLLAGGGLMLRGTRRGVFGRVSAGSFARWWRRVTRGR